MHRNTSHLHLVELRWEKMTKKGLTSKPDGEGSISAAIFNQHIGSDGWMYSSAVMRHPGMLLWLLGASVVRRNDHVDKAEDDDGLDGIDEMDDILAKGALQPWMLLGIFKSMYAAAMSQSWMKDVYGGSNLEYSGTVIPVDSM
ncbi:predicted protein [Lichtheimia corymbifera JMRC:FSU:9682]|uniref:Uncharacterized protein n=1 Tax=Lichtheimia corymbifera JMRC:FSU:9682 TaxID=1263082 RepID=A0A068S0K9_9FUNG|nr:predicted protein [Lichtheimia corymbifera JMRC:FSU:9682]